MGNITSSLNGETLDLLAKVSEEAWSNPSTILDTLNTYGRDFASALSNAINDAKADPSAVLDSVKAHGHNIATSLSKTVKETDSKPLVANLLVSIQEHWHKAVALLPVPLKRLVGLVASWWIPFTVTITILYLFGGFGRAGVRGGSLASKYQSQVYGGFTPKGSIFASSTSASMRGTTPVIYKAAALVVASFTVVVVYRSWVMK